MSPADVIKVLFRTEAVEPKNAGDPPQVIWVAQGIEYDIVGQGKDMDTAFVDFQRAYITNMTIARDLRKPLRSLIGKAPDGYLAEFAAAKKRGRVTTCYCFELPRMRTAPRRAAQPQRVFAAIGS